MGMTAERRINSTVYNTPLMGPHAPRSMGSEILADLWREGYVVLPRGRWNLFSNVTRLILQGFQNYLHPADPQAIPIPGFPSMNAFAAWVGVVKGEDLKLIVDLLILTLRADDWPQQYAAMGALRHLGYTCDAEGYREDFHWKIDGPDMERVIIFRPDHTTVEVP